MINLITAIGNPYINEQIKNKKEYNVIIKDIQYFEGILEILNIYKNIHVLLISTDVLIEINFIEIIKEKFENLEIIIFMDKKIEKDIAYFNSKGIYKIYSNNHKGYTEYLKKISFSENNITEQVRDEMKNLKKEILKNKNKKYFKEESINKLKNREEKIFFSKDLIEKVIMISGARGVRKKYFRKYFFKVCS